MQFKLSEFTTLVSKWIQTLFGSEQFLIIWEVSKIKQWNSRFYIELVEYQNSRVVAHAHALLTNQSILWKPLREWWITLEELVGQQILITCLVRYHKDYGVQLDIQHISSEYTLWSIKKKTMSIKDELTRLWILYKNNQKKLWLPPYRIAIVSSASSEWLKDFLNVLQESDYRISYELFDTAIHGNAANEEIHRTLRKIYEKTSYALKDEELRSAHWEQFMENWEFPFDLVAIVRGGGGSSGILWHNDIHIAKGICFMPIPVMIAVGHSSDQFLLDEISAYSAKTPTDAAYQIISYYEDCNAELSTLYIWITTSIKEKLQSYELQLELIMGEIRLYSEKKLTDYNKNIQSRYDFIMATRPQKLLQSGYALLETSDWKVMNKLEIDDLQVGEDIILKVYDKEFLVSVTEIIN